MATKSRSMKPLTDFQKRKYGTPPTISGQHATRPPLYATPIQEDAIAVAVMYDQDDASSYVNSNVFELMGCLRITYLSAVLAPDPESAGTFLLKLHEMLTTFAIA